MNWFCIHNPGGKKINQKKKEKQEKEKEKEKMI